jgi:hypothetical protein
LEEIGSEEQKGKLARGKEWCMGLTEPDVGTGLRNTKTFAKEDGDGYVINGQKIFISSADRVFRMTLITKMEPFVEVPKKAFHGHAQLVLEDWRGSNEGSCNCQWGKDGHRDLWGVPERC